MAKRRKQKKSLRRFLPIVDVGLGIAMGCLFAVTYLALKPVDVRDSARRDNEKQPGRHEISYVRGRTGLVRTSVIEAKQSALIARNPGGVQLSEEEINRWVSAQYDQADRSQEFEDWNAEFKTDLPAFRISGGDTQIGMVFDFSVLGITRKIVLQTTGGFQSEGGRFVFVPKSMHLGSCPINIPFLSRRIFDFVAGRFEVPSDLHAAWGDIRGLVAQNGSLKIDFNSPAPRQLEPEPVPVATVQVPPTPETEPVTTEAEATMETADEPEAVTESTATAETATDETVEATANEDPSVEAPAIDVPSTEEQPVEDTPTDESVANEQVDDAVVGEESEPGVEETVPSDVPVTTDEAEVPAEEPVATE